MDTTVAFPFDPSGGGADTLTLLHLDLRSDGSFNARLNQSSDTQRVCQIRRLQLVRSITSNLVVEDHHG